MQPIYLASAIVFLGIFILTIALLARRRISSRLRDSSETPLSTETEHSPGEKRREKRYPAGGLLFEYQEKLLPGVYRPWKRVKIRDISGGGFGFYSKKFLPRGKTLSVRIRFFQSGRGAPFVTGGRVVYSKFIPFTSGEYKVGARFKGRKFTKDSLGRLIGPGK